MALVAVDCELVAATKVNNGDIMTVSKKNSKPVLVTTEFRGVFFGYIKDDKKTPEQITLTGARNCISWHSSIGGFLGLASEGPNKECRIGRRVPELTLYKISSISPVEDGAVKKWESA